jgi:hypothetical protein
MPREAHRPLVQNGPIVTTGPLSIEFCSESHINLASTHDRAMEINGLTNSSSPKAWNQNLNHGTYKPKMSSNPLQLPHAVYLAVLDDDIQSRGCFGNSYTTELL